VQPTRNHGNLTPEAKPCTRNPIAPHTPNPIPPTTHNKNDASIFTQTRVPSLDPTPYTLHPTPYTLHPTPYTLDPKPKPETVEAKGVCWRQEVSLVNPKIVDKSEATDVEEEACLSFPGMQGKVRRHKWIKVP
jgi:hypothetical protein